MFRFLQNFGGMFRRNQGGEVKYSLIIFFDTDDVMMTSYFHVCKFQVLLLKTDIRYTSQQWLWSRKFVQRFLDNGQTVECNLKIEMIGGIELFD